MNKNGSLLKSTKIKAVVVFIVAILATAALSIVLINLNNMEKIEELLESKRPSMPSKLVDRNGRIICEFYSDEKRDNIHLDQIPEYLIQALILWEDESFYVHHGFNPIATMRAALNYFLKRMVSGASTITQQLSRTLFLTTKRTFTRKITELWIAFQLEKKYTKNEILSLYLNNIPLGKGIKGVQAASRFYFSKDVQELSYAEAASIITLISNPSLYSLRRPKTHKHKQRLVLNRMVINGVITQSEADRSFEEFWLNYKTNKYKDKGTGAFLNRTDKAPFFSNWVLQKLEKELENVDVYKDGLTIHSTLDLEYDRIAHNLMSAIVERQQKIFENYQSQQYEVLQNYYMDAISLFGQTFSLTNVNIGRNRLLKRGIGDYRKTINDPLNLTAQMLGIELLDTLTENSASGNGQSAQQIMKQVQGALIAMDNKTGQIVAMYGGRFFDSNNRFNYAMQSRKQPGSSFKPLVYSAALDSGMYTPATIIEDRPYVFTFGSDDPDEWYRPYNYGATYSGDVTVRRALKRSLNIPATKIMYNIGYSNGYKVPIDRAALLLGINSQEDIEARFKPEISTVLGTGSVSPLEMTQAFSVFANLGQRRYPHTILYVEDRDGNIIYNQDKELTKYYREKKKQLEIISPQNAFLMTDILKGTIHDSDGFLHTRKERMIEEGKPFPDVELAAKTGTTQNWSDVWLIGFSPEITLGMWVGFKEYGITLGYEQSSLLVLGTSWLEFMRRYHLGKGKLSFKNPGGLYKAQVSRLSGKLPSESNSESDLIYEWFMPGTLPTEKCNVRMLKDEQELASMEHFSNVYNKNYNEFGDNQILSTNNIEVDESLLVDSEVETSGISLEDDFDSIDLFEDSETFDFDEGKEVEIDKDLLNQLNDGESRTDEQDQTDGQDQAEGTDQGETAPESTEDAADPAEPDESESPGEPVLDDGASSEASDTTSDQGT